MSDEKRFESVLLEVILHNVYGALQAEALNRRLLRDGLPDETPLQQMFREREVERAMRAMRVERSDER